MAGIILDSELHAIARYLVKYEDFIKNEYQGTVDINKEIEVIYTEYGFGIIEEYPDFHHDVHHVYSFERNRKLSSLPPIAYAKFRLDLLTGNNRIQQMKNELAQELKAKRT